MQRIIIGGSSCPDTLIRRMEERLDVTVQTNHVGRLKVKGASVIEACFNSTTASVDSDGYFDTGDLAVIDETGSLTITGRSKDLIKSGGEWINPGEIEEIIGRLPSVAWVAVIARPDPKWGERPVLIVEARQGHSIEEQMLLDSLRGKIPDWWLPDRVVRIAQMPLAATGKIDKKQLRADYGVA